MLVELLEALELGDLGLVRGEPVDAGLYEGVELWGGDCKRALVTLKGSWLEVWMEPMPSFVRFRADMFRYYRVLYLCDPGVDLGVIRVAVLDMVRASELDSRFLDEIQGIFQKA